MKYTAGSSGLNVRIQRRISRQCNTCNKKPHQAVSHTQTPVLLFLLLFLVSFLRNNLLYPEPKQKHVHMAKVPGFFWDEWEEACSWVIVNSSFHRWVSRDNCTLSLTHSGKWMSLTSIFSLKKKNACGFYMILPSSRKRESPSLNWSVLCFIFFNHFNLWDILFLCWKITSLPKVRDCFTLI